MILQNKDVEIMSQILERIERQKETIIKSLVDNKKPIASFVKERRNVPGVYAFFIKPINSANIYDFTEAWSKEVKKYLSRVVASRFQVSTLESKPYYTLYIGKSEKVFTRVNEHLVHTKGISTYGLKLAERVLLKSNYEISYSIVSFPELINVDASIKQFVITKIESQLRGTMNPWVGKQ